MDKKCCVKLYGELYMAEVPKTCPSPLSLGAYQLLSVGDVSEITLDRSYNELSLPNLRTAAFGDACYAKILDTETISFTMTCVKTKNLQKALGGSIKNITAATVTDEEQTVPASPFGSFIPTDYLIDTSETVTVKNTAGTTTYEAGEDYYVKSSGIVVADGGDMVAEVIKITYKSLAQDRITPSSFAASEYIMKFDGNNAQNGDPLSYIFYRVRIDPAETLQLLGEDFLTIPVTGTVLPSNCHFDINGNPLRSNFDLNQ